jgi:hypothetical protein
MSKFSILGAIGGVIAIVAVFLEWIDGGWTGWEFIKEYDLLSALDVVYFAILPIGVLVLGALAILLSLIGKPKALSAIGGLVLTLSIAFPVLWIAKFATSIPPIMDILTDFVGIGIFVGMAAGVVLIIASFIK